MYIYIAIGTDIKECNGFIRLLIGENGIQLLYPLVKILFRFLGFAKKQSIKLDPFH